MLPFDFSSFFFSLFLYFNKNFTVVRIGYVTRRRMMSFQIWPANQGCSPLLRTVANSCNAFKHSELISIRLGFILIKYIYTYTAHFLTIALEICTQEKKNDDHIIDDGTGEQNKIFLV